jgi:predicted metal-dependent hydrolase
MKNITTSIGPCSLKRSSRRTLAISVLPDGTVEVVAPLSATLPAIQKKIEKRAVWIHRQRHYFAYLHAERPARRYCTGATHRYLGRQYRLKVIIADLSEVKLRGAYLHVRSRYASGKAVAALLAGWMREHAKEQFGKRLEKWRAWCVKRGLPEPKLHLLDMPKRWGSTRANGHIFLNPELVRAPAPCIDYVILHEVCHIKHPRHDKPFYAELERLCPRWQAIKQRLEMSEL